MSKINYGRVILGGIVAGIIADFLDWFLNSFLVGHHWENAMKSLNRPNAYHGAFIYWLYLGYMIGGILLVWVYAAIRPRFGAGVKTAVYAGLVVWALTSLPNISNAITGMFSPRLMLYATFTGAVEVVIGAIVGAALYKEAESTSVYAAASEARQTAP